MTGAVVQKKRGVTCHDWAAFEPVRGTQASPYYFSKHVFCCIEGGHAVMLDLKRDKYLCVPRRRLDALGASLCGWPEQRGQKRDVGQSSDEDADSTLSAMFRQGLITNLESESNPVALTSIAAPARTLAEALSHPVAHSLPRRSLRHFVVAATRAAIALRWRRIEEVVNAVKHRRMQRVGDGDGVNLGTCGPLVTAFHHFRPLFPRDYLCLFDSLALLKFLARYGQYPRWVFGVQLGPFGAHCWVQSGDIVLNDTVERVRSYTPIMVI